MIIKPQIQWHQVPSLRAPYLYWRDVIVVLENPNKVLVVDVWRDQLAKYSPPPGAKTFKFTYRIGVLDQESVKYLECVGEALQRRLNPLFRRNFRCDKDTVVMLP
ncbi:hypothetical protein MetMK1DRAFT_00009000 [Metallosphaera yellowstonensis MK1]|jgi:hypothetical protein|uniref:Uncharacterized protein n=1 Tax=Metallosphaera yellowstonensis MK1 TaxID=671065 RepID=H2C2C7_9CREN|nr:hypothetical protein [Metallosphaera yellowstonensis]EHP70398.1 hypothetical protein MetMK1DRAFT_00009000 [Metallosphaera yellowstonensis MK1]